MKMMAAAPSRYYEKHPLLGAADRATLYAFVARKQPHECRFWAFSAVLSHFLLSDVQFPHHTPKSVSNRLKSPRRALKK